MPSRKTPLVTDQIYHIIARGLDKRPIFQQTKDYNRFIKLLFYYQRNETLQKFSTLSKTDLYGILNKEPKSKLVEIISYCLMPNHFHILIRQIEDGGISKYIRLISDSYIRYYNVKYKRRGTLFEGSFNAVLIEDDNQLVHISRYIHLNPIVSYITNNLDNYPWSSYLSYMNNDVKSILRCQNKIILEHFPSREAYKKLILDHKDYAEKLEKIKHLLLE